VESFLNHEKFGWRFRLQNVNIGVIGTGGISGAHFKAYSQLPDAKIVAVADILPERAKAAAERWGVEKWFTDFNDLLSLPDLHAVVVCTYNQAHRDPVVAALESGKHVFVEKPLAATLQDAVDMVRAAKKNGLILQTGFWPRFSHELRTAREIVRSGALGDIYYAQAIGGGRRRIPGGSFLKKDTAGSGTIADIGCYDLDRFLFVTDHPTPTHVSAIASDKLAKSVPNVLGDWGHNPKEVEVEDFGAAFVRFEQGFVLNFVSYWAAHAESLGPSLILGTKGGLLFSPLTLYRDEFGAMTDVTFQHLPRVDCFLEQARAFVNAVKAGGPSPVDPEGVLLVNVIIDGIYRSAKEGREVEVSIPKV
jgi:predicted dehydrogenase